MARSSFNGRDARDAYPGLLASLGVVQREDIEASANEASQIRCDGFGEPESRAGRIVGEPGQSRPRQQLDLRGPLSQRRDLTLAKSKERDSS